MYTVPVLFLFLAISRLFAYLSHELVVVLLSIYNGTLTLLAPVLDDLGFDHVSGGVLLGECQGDCDVDADCDDNLKCFKNGPGEANVPTGCSGIAREDMDYCYDHPGLYYIDSSHSLLMCYLIHCVGFNEMI